MRRISRKAVRLAAAAVVVLATALNARATAPDVAAGEGIYLRGVLPSGKPLQGVNDAGVRLHGAAAACVNCHRHSGFGAKEGRSVIPPITGRYLFRAIDAKGANRYVPHVESVRGRRTPYTEATLARAIRDGVDADGRPMKVLMPHFDLGETEIASLTAYLKSLDTPRVPGVSDTTLHFATIVTPDADPAKRKGMLAVLEQFFAERNARQMKAAPRVQTTRVIEFMVHRNWQLHVWDLKGAPSTWGQQLDRLMRDEPVFAVLSGLAGKTWEPVHAFCERARVPCLFPNVETPVDAEHDFYSVYFSRGVLLEADLMARRLADAAGDDARLVHQIYRDDDTGAVAARALAARLQKSGVRVENHVIGANDPADRVAAAVSASAGAGALVGWLRPNDIAALGAPPPGEVSLYLSGLMGGLERAPVPAAFRARTHIAYPFDLPDRRRVRLDFAFGWFRIRNVPMVAEQVQADTFLACGLLSETMNHLSDTFVRDYLVERIEDLVEHRVITGYYPRLTLASGQRFASKGGYLVRLGGERGTTPIAETAWVVP